MRGLFTAGILDFFLENNITFNECVAVSAGSCHACSYLAKQKGRAFAVATEFLDDPRYFGVRSLITTGDLFGVQFAYHEIPEKLYPVDNETFINSQTQFFAVATNCKTGNADYLEIFDIYKDMYAIRSSSSLPFVSRVVPFRDELYLDGGIDDPIPVNFMRNRDVEKIVVILTQPKNYRKKANSHKLFTKVFYHKYPKIAEKLISRYKKYNDTLDFIYKEEKAGNLFIIQPNLSFGFKRLEKDVEKLEDVYNTGYNQAKELLPNLLSYCEFENLSK